MEGGREDKDTKLPLHTYTHACEAVAAAAAAALLPIARFRKMGGRESVGMLRVRTQQTKTAPPGPFCPAELRLQQRATSPRWQQEQRRRGGLCPPVFCGAAPPGSGTPIGGRSACLLQPLLACCPLARVRGCRRAPPSSPPRLAPHADGLLLACAHLALGFPLLSRVPWHAEPALNPLLFVGLLCGAAGAGAAVVFRCPLPH